MKSGSSCVRSRKTAASTLASRHRSAIDECMEFALSITDMPDERSCFEQSHPHPDLTRLAALQKRSKELAVEIGALHRKITRLVGEADQLDRDRIRLTWKISLTIRPAGTR